MNRITFIFVLIFALAKLQAQDYQISFVGSGATTTIATIQVQNLTQNKNLTLNGTDVLNLVGTTGIEQLTVTGDNLLKVYPNPSKNNSYIEFEIPQSGIVTIDLINTTGKKVASTQKKLQAGIQTFRITGLSSGIYAIHIKSGNFSCTGKIISGNSAKSTVEINYVNSNLKSENKPKLKSTKALVQMNYTDGDRLLFKGISGNYATVITDIPTQSKVITFSFIKCADSDSNHYATVTINNQTWMQENLKTTKYNDGTSIAKVTDNTAWGNLITPAYCWYNNDSATYTQSYGALYNWYVVDTTSNSKKNVCPSGWHVPSDDDWGSLSAFLVGSGGKALKSINNWNSNGNGRDDYGFSALPGGYRNYNTGSVYEGTGNYGFWWSTGTQNNLDAWSIILSFDQDGIGKIEYSKHNGFSVRCMKD